MDAGPVEPKHEPRLLIPITKNLSVKILIVVVVVVVVVPHYFYH